MDWLEFWSSIIKSLSWPIIVLIAVYFLRKPVTQLIEKIAEWKLASLKYKDFEAIFSQGLQKVESELEESETSNSEPGDSQTNKESPSKNSSNDLGASIVVGDNNAVVGDNNSSPNINKIAKEAPYLAVVMSWLLVEDELNSVINKLVTDESLSIAGLKRKPPSAKMHYLVENNYLDRSYFDAFLELARLRNVAVHNYREAKNISYIESKKYNKLTKKIIKGLQSIKFD
ncbi:Uncharacterised protein [Bacillus subtilis]|uniref:hypothetical protein n=1 Tax=Bacillus subtilis TaxID=1423 RepID=UPI000D9DC97D|nr:hypothetical protein [Bacillus subtilis]MED4460431.1 hypothetical protein [Bacillus subtilis]SPY10752.1 Uncharacterised protein [Bacillus subtilis]